MAHAASPNLGHGFPTPGPQEPTGQNIMDHIFFLNEEKWKKAREFGQYDLIIVGTGFCGYAVAHRALQNNKTAKILMVERGPFFLPEHFQNLPPATSQTLGGMAETFPWTVDGRTASGLDGVATWNHGMLPFFGGRSTTWSAWCPIPTVEELEGWPKSIVEKLHPPHANHVGKILEKAKELLNVQPVDKVDEGRSNQAIHDIHKTCKRPVYLKLQNSMQQRLEDARDKGTLSDVGIYRTDPAPLASKSDTGTDFQKFSTTGPLLDLLQNYENLHIVTNCTVKKIISQKCETEGTEIATALDTSRGICPIGNAKLVLAMGALPPATLIQNSFPNLPNKENIGGKLTSHMITAITARIPKKVMQGDNGDFGKLEVGAMYVAGVSNHDYKKQFHIQLSALHDEDPVGNYATAMRYMPDVVATASKDQLRTSKDYVIFVCAVLGELDIESGKSSFVHNSSDPDVTTNSILRLVSNTDNDLQTWDAMDKATFATLEQVVGCENKGELEYWKEGKGWTSDKPSIKNRRIEAPVHESSTLHFGDDSTAAVDASNYKLKGVDNVYITGAGLWPRGGSWNPTLTMVALSIDLADNLVPPNLAVPALDLEGVISTLDTADNVYMVIKDRKSNYLWVNDNFANLVGEKPENLIGQPDNHHAHVLDDMRVLESGKPLLNLEETIEVPSGDGGTKVINIRTQKGLVRHKSNPNEIIGISVCFSIRDEEAS